MFCNPIFLRSDLMQQFFLTETKTLQNTHWDDTLKNNDHYDFLFSAKKKGLHLVTCTDLKVQHNKKVTIRHYWNPISFLLKFFTTH